MKNVDVDIVIPVLDGYKEFKSLIESLNTQTNIKIQNIIVPISIGNNIKDANNSIEFCKKKNITYYTFSKHNYSHSLTREKAILNYCKSDIVILLTQDVKLINPQSMYNLVRDIASNEVVYTYGRQICRKKRSLEGYIREFNYPNTSKIYSKDRIKDNLIKNFFASDTFAALNRNIFIKLGGYNGIDIPANEDMLYMHTLITAGYKAKYCAGAIVEHYHSFTPGKLFKRYYNFGVFLSRVELFKKYNRNTNGKELAFNVLKKAFKNFDIITLIRWLPNMGIRYFASKCGCKCKH